MDSIELTGENKLDFEGDFCSSDNVW